MGLSLDVDPSVTPRSIAASGGTITVSFEVSGVPGKTRIKILYSLAEDVPYVFAPDDSKEVDSGPVDVPASGRRVSNRLTLKKSPPSAPRQAFIPIGVKLEELDDAGNVVDELEAPAVLVDIET